MKFLIMILIAFFGFQTQAGDSKNVRYKKTQNVSFDGTDIDGTVRSPDGAYLVQKKGVKFLPLYKVKKQFDENIKESVDYLR